MLSRPMQRAEKGMLHGLPRVTMTAATRFTNKEVLKRLLQNL